MRLQLDYACSHSLCNNPRHRATCSTRDGARGFERKMGSRVGRRDSNSRVLNLNPEQDLISAPRPTSSDVAGTPSQVEQKITQAHEDYLGRKRIWIIGPAANASDTSIVHVRTQGFGVHTANPPRQFCQPTSSRRPSSLDLACMNRPAQSNIS
ncbi:hypothetical protein OH76DRAFT_431592 [Lentinus brumalis]|uniref:Uncharacterized protein n=1 Tax=Lentinus brumalis TaxID=2498619 RepID=A0A371DDJ2_9APHY|nr:hypothetical protein OH76DRAFT_431592 [Polyporus brumalis]